MTTPMPDWLARAEAEYADQTRRLDQYRAKNVRDQADRITTKLRILGIEPLRAATTTRGGGVLVPALLVEPDAENALYGISAGWDDSTRQVRLIITDYEHDPRSTPAQWDGPPLLHLVDIPHARNHAHAPQGPAREPNLRAIALGAATAKGPYPHPLVPQFAALTAAFLHLADTIRDTHDHR